MSNTLRRTLSTAAVLACLGTVALAAPQKSKDKGKDAPADPVVEHVRAQAKKANVSKSDPEWKLRLDMPELAPFEEGKVYTWHLETSEGPIDVELMPKVAPRHVTCTLFLTELGFYDELTFHRVITGFMAQGGCPTGNGTGNPGFRYDGEFSKDVRHDRPGLLSMANAGPGTDGSQFFLTFVPTPHLDDKHTIFGEAVGEASFATLKKLEAAGSPGGATTKPLSIVKATWSAKEWRPELPSSPDDADASLAELAEWTGKQQIDTSKKRWKTKLPKPPLLTFDAEKRYFWHLETNHGVVKVKLLPDVAPMHVSSTMFLSRIGFYDDLTFHRIIPEFMAQGGCPNGNGRGGPGYAYDGEFSPDVRHDRPGLLSMANAGPGTDGSQFFLTFVPYPSLDGKHTIFGEVVEGLDVLKKLEGRGSPNGRTKEKVELRRTTISVE